MPGPSSSTTISISRPPRGRAPSPTPFSGEKEMALSSRLVSTWPRRPSSPSTRKAPSNGAALDHEHDAAGVVAEDVAEDLDDAAQHHAHVDGLDLLQRELGVEARGVGHVGDQPVEPLQLVLDLLHESVALLLVLGVGQRLGGRAGGGERVLELVRDVLRRSARWPRCAGRGTPSCCGRRPPSGRPRRRARRAPAGRGAP